MATKKVSALVKLQIAAGQATPAPPVGTALGPHGVNIMDFCKQFNAKTSKEPEGMIIPALVTIYSQGRFLFPAAGPLGLVVVEGWLLLLPARGRKVFLPGLIAILAAANLTLWWTGLLPVYFQPFDP